jgi:hypothetical protein
MVALARKQLDDLTGHVELYVVIQASASKNHFWVIADLLCFMR